MTVSLCRCQWRIMQQYSLLALLQMQILQRMKMHFWCNSGARMNNFRLATRSRSCDTSPYISVAGESFRMQSRGDSFCRKTLTKFIILPFEPAMLREPLASGRLTTLIQFFESFENGDPTVSNIADRFYLTVDATLGTLRPARILAWHFLALRLRAANRLNAYAPCYQMSGHGTQPPKSKYVVVELVASICACSILL